ncbi:MAG: glutamyl-tRNA(Gln) amidotransferase subunit D [Candidatus Pacearchaeota archaeon]|nr:MAG: glutamyl-tRNA(Gln) amidotransferase subunit D [Candidatus Pacearchaeota archaeon]
MKNINPGDFVELIFPNKSYKGILLESPKDEKGVILLKLDSGYNIGFKKKDISEIRLIKKAEKKEEKIEIKIPQEKPKIAMIITGGTIASKLDTKTGAVSPLTKPEEFFKFYPKIFDKVSLEKIIVPFTKASEDMDFKDWKKIAKITYNLLNNKEIKGVIITHGTDTLHYTASALSFFLQNLNKPVILTYSQRSIDRASSDANLNLQCSALASISDIAEVLLVGHATMNDDFCFAILGTKARKLHTSRRDAFKSVNRKPIAKIWPDKIEILSEHKLRNEKNKVKLDAKFNNKVALIKFYPGQNPDILEFYHKNKYEGLVIEATGLGHVSSLSKNSFLKKIKKLTKDGIIVCVTSQCIYGRVDPYVYSNGRELEKAGAIFLEDMLSETAFVKLGWILGHKEWKKNKQIIKQKMLTNFAGEINERLDEQFHSL